MIGSTHGEDEDMIACHGTLKEIIKLQYHGERSVVLFRCDWSKWEEKAALKNERSCKSIDERSLLTKDNTLILATQAKKVFYLPNAKNGKECCSDNGGDFHVDEDGDGGKMDIHSEQK